MEYLYQNLKLESKQDLSCMKNALGDRKNLKRIEFNRVKAVSSKILEEMEVDLLKATEQNQQSNRPPQQESQDIKQLIDHIQKQLNSSKKELQNSSNANRKEVSCQC